MRGLNLSRLASHGKASEGSFFKDQQTTQAAKLRKKLSPDEIADLKTDISAKASNLATVDTLSSISGHSAYRQIVQSSAKDAVHHEKPIPSSLLGRIKNIDSAQYTGITRKAREARDSQVDSSIMRVLGSGKLNVYSSMATERKRARTAPVRPLPGSSRYGDGAVLGLASFSVATALIASVGLTGGLYAYYNPSIIDRIGERTRKFASSVDATVGERMRSFSKRMTTNGPLLTVETTEKARDFASDAFGFSSSKLTVQADERGEKGV